MVALLLGELADPVHEGKRFGEVTEFELTLQSAFNQGITGRKLHRG